MCLCVLWIRSDSGGLASTWASPCLLQGGDDLVLYRLPAPRAGDLFCKMRCCTTIFCCASTSVTADDTVFQPASPPSSDSMYFAAVNCPCGHLGRDFTLQCKHRHGPPVPVQLLFANDPDFYSPLVVRSEEINFMAWTYSPTP